MSWRLEYRFVCRVLKRGLRSGERGIAARERCFTQRCHNKMKNSVNAHTMSCVLELLERSAKFQKQLMLLALNIALDYYKTGRFWMLCTTVQTQPPPLFTGLEYDDMHLFSKCCLDHSHGALLLRVSVGKMSPLFWVMCDHKVDYYCAINLHRSPLNYDHPGSHA